MEVRGFGRQKGTPSSTAARSTRSTSCPRSRSSSRRRRLGGVEGGGDDHRRRQDGLDRGRQGLRPARGGSGAHPNGRTGRRRDLAGPPRAARAREGQATRAPLPAPRLREPRAAGGDAVLTERPARATLPPAAEFLDPAVPRRPAWRRWGGWASSIRPAPSGTSAGSRKRRSCATRWRRSSRGSSTISVPRPTPTWRSTTWSASPPRRSIGAASTPCSPPTRRPSRS